MRSGDTPLLGRNVLIVEDEYLIADDLSRTLEQLGAEVVGPASTLTQARRLISDAAIDCAVLDINLEGEMAFPLAEELSRRNVPFVVASGYGPTTLAGRVEAAATLEKPCSAHRLAEALVNTLEAAVQASVKQS